VTTFDLPPTAVAPRTSRRAASAAPPGAVRSRTAAAPASRRGTDVAAHRAARPSSAYPILLLLVAVLCMVGLVMVLSASSVQSLRQYGSPWHFFERQLLWLVLGVGAFGVAWRIGPTRLRRLAPVGMIGSMALLMAVLVPGVGVRVAGASRWIGTSTVQIQPSEIAKIALIFFAADLIDRRAGVRDWKYQMMPVVLVLVALVGLVMLQPDMGTTMVLASIALAMLFTAGLPAKPLAGILGGGVAGFGVLALAAPYRVRRLTSFLHPLHDMSNTGWQASQGLAALGSGGWFGKGLGSSIASWGYLPNAQTDFIFAVVGEELGLFGSAALAGLFAALALVGIRIACRCPDRYSALIVAGVTAWLVAQAVINIGAVVGLLPVTGVPLPFVSFGGSSMVIALFGAGIVAHAARAS
jgi:cell division protein FtsW